MAGAPRLFKTEAIVLRQRKLGEADRIVTLYTPNYGKLEAKAKGVRKTSSRMAGHLQPLTHCAVQLAQGRSLAVVAGCQTVEAFAGLRDDLERLSRGLYAAELVDRFAPEGMEGYALYRLLLDTLRRLAGDEASSAGSLAADARSGQAGQGIDIALRYFELRLLELAGFRPELERCVTCEAAAGGAGGYFSPAAGGVLCPRCGGGNVASRRLSAEALRAMRFLQRGPWREAAGLRLSPAAAQEVERHLRAYIIYVLERDVNSAAFVDQLRREGIAEPIEV